MRKRSSNSEFHKCVLLPDSPLLHKQTKSSTKVILIEDPNIAGLASRQIRGEAVKGELFLFLDFPDLNFSLFYHSSYSNNKSFLWPIHCNFFSEHNSLNKKSKEMVSSIMAILLRSTFSQSSLTLVVTQVSPNQPFLQLCTITTKKQKKISYCCIPPIYFKM